MAVCALGNHSGGRRCVRLAESARGGRRLAAGGRAAAPLTSPKLTRFFVFDEGGPEKKVGTGTFVYRVPGSPVYR